MPVLTISREFGAGGRTLGKLIAKKTGYAFIDKQIAELVAEKAKVSHNWVQSIEKEAGGTLLKFISGLVSKRFVDRILNEGKGYIDEEVYIDTLREVIAQIGKQDNVVILGRGGQYILREQKNACHLLLIADKPDRIRFMEKHYNLLPTEAKTVVTTQDKRRLNLFRKFGKENFDNPELYDMVLNMSKLSIESACDLVVNLLNR